MICSFTAVLILNPSWDLLAHSSSAIVLDSVVLHGIFLILALEKTLVSNHILFGEGGVPERNASMILFAYTATETLL